MLLKIQLSLTSSMDANMKRERMALIYDEGKQSVLLERPTSMLGDVEAIMGDKLCAYFEADVEWQLDHGCHRVHDVTVLHKRDCACRQNIHFVKMIEDQGW